MSLSPLAPGSAIAPVGPNARTKVERLSHRGIRWIACVATAWLALGCAVPAVEDTGQVEQNGLHALVLVDRDLEGESEQTTALSAFVRVKVGSEIDELLTLTNPELAVPETTGCRVRSSSPVTLPEARGALPEFLLADSVVLRVGDAPFELTPYAFPRVGDQMGGALYSSRRLPTPAVQGPEKYKLSVRGLLPDTLVPAHEPEGTFELPAGVLDISVSGTPFESVTSVSLASPLDLTWTPGEPPPADSASVRRPDWVVVDLESRGQTLSCAFLTTEASGSIGESYLRELAGQAGEAMTLSVRLAGVRPAQTVIGFESLRVRFEVTKRRIVAAAL